MFHVSIFGFNLTHVAFSATLYVLLYGANAKILFYCVFMFMINSRIFFAINFE